MVTNAVKQIKFKDGIRELTLSETLEEFKNLIHKLGRSWQEKYESDDLFQIGSLALIKAYDKYDISNNINFSTYLTTYITRKFLNYNRDNKENKKDIAYSLNEEIKQKNGELVERFVFIADENENIEKTIMDKYENNKLEELLSSLPEEDSKLIYLRYYKKLSQKEVGNIFNRSQNAISLREKRILNS